MDHLFYLCLVFVMLSRIFIAALWSPAVIGLFVMFNCISVSFSFGILGQMWIISIADLSRDFATHDASDAGLKLAVQ